MTELDVVREYQATKFYRLLEEGGDPGTEVMEVDSGDAFEKGIAEWEQVDAKPAAETSEPETTQPDDFEPLP